MDVVIELYRPGTTEPFLLWIWECKDYQDKVPVDDIEEFHAKMEQIKLHKTKGTVVCRNGFQESAVTYAESMGIGLARLLPTESLVRMTEAAKHKEMPKDRVNSGLTQERTGIFFESYFFGLLSSGKGVDSLSDLIAGEICHFFDDAL